MSLLNTSSALVSFNNELRAADESLVGNEDILRAVLSGCGDCIKILDLSGRLQFMSEGGKRVMEVDDFASLKGCPWPDFWAGEGNAKAKNAMEAARKGQTVSFRGSADTAKGNSRYWNVQVSPIFGTAGNITHLLSISRDITAEWIYETNLKEAAERQQMLTQEMHHRINNTMSVISAIASQTLRGNNVDSARDAFVSRLATLASANKLLLQADWDRAPISDVIKRALAPHDPGQGRVRFDGPNLKLSPQQALSLALATHELATNATKYGALSNDTGTVNIRWYTSYDTIPELCIAWQERGGPPILDQQPRRKGFGSRLINTVLAKEFNGEVVVSYDVDGVVCKLTAPLSALEDN